jgi:two-component system sensor histidine kinase/response regulator
MKAPHSLVKKILVVEDEPLLSKLCSKVLSRAGYQVEIAGNGALAEEKISDDFDLYLIDMKTPVKSGRQLYQAILNRDPRDAEKVIFTSGYLLDDATRSLLALSRRPFLAKPYTPDELITVVNEALSDAVLR